METKIQLNDLACGKRICALILCAGNGSRTGLNYNKVLHYIGKQTVLETTIEKFLQSAVTDIYVAVSEHDEKEIKEIVDGYSNIKLCLGGSTRGESVKKGLIAMGECDVAVIHDGARPFIMPKTIDESILCALQYGSGVVAVPTVDTIKDIGNKKIKTLQRQNLINVMTPQTFIYKDILLAYNSVTENCTDDSDVYEKAGFTPTFVNGDYSNIKVTTASDLFSVSPLTKIGVGFDVHPLKAGLKLIIGGVVIEHSKGLEGHSDADVLTHAIMDAILSAAGLKDIGVLFSNKDAAYKGISSIKLLKKVMELVLESGHKVNNVSAVIMAEKPMMFAHIDKMRKILADTIGMDIENVNISATTTEKLGIVGEEKGIAASAGCTLNKI